MTISRPTNLLPPLMQLRVSTRSNDIDRILAACEAMPIQTADLTTWQFAEGHTEAVSKALRQSIGLLRRSVWPTSSSFIIECATRVVNLSRLLSGPQPMECPHCGFDAYADPEHDPSCSTWDHTDEDWEYIPAQEHAFRLYIDALLIAKYRGWWDWMQNHWNLDTDARRPSRLCPPETYKIWVTERGTIRCGAQCPRLPKLELP